MRIALLLFVAALPALCQNPPAYPPVTYSDPTGQSCQANQVVVFAPTGKWFTCQSGVYAASGGGGGGTGTVTSVTVAGTASQITATGTCTGTTTINCTLSIPANAILVTPSIGAATGTSLSVTGGITTGSAGGVSGSWCPQGSTSGQACITVVAAAGTPNSITLPTTTGAAGTFLQTDGGNPQHLTWTTPTTSTPPNYQTSGINTGLGGTTFTPTHTLDVYDAGGSGVTQVSVRSGASQSSTYSLGFLSSAGATQAEFDFDGLVWASTNGASSITLPRTSGTNGNMVIKSGNNTFGSGTSDLTISTASALTSFSANGNDTDFMQLNASASPSAAGAGTLAILGIRPTINQTGSSTGTIRGIYSHATLTKAIDWREGEFASTLTITGTVADGQVSSWILTPGYTAATAQTVTRHNYLLMNNPTVAGAGPAAVTDAAIIRFDAAAGTHKALAGTGGGVAVTIGDGPAGSTAGTPQGWMKINVNGTLRYVHFW